MEGSSEIIIRLFVHRARIGNNYSREARQASIAGRNGQEIREACNRYSALFYYFTLSMFTLCSKNNKVQSCIISYVMCNLYLTLLTPLSGYTVFQYVCISASIYGTYYLFLFQWAISLHSYIP